MTLRDRVVAWVAVGLLAIGPAHAQQAQGTDVTGSSSDVSGTLTQSDTYLFQSDESRIRMNDIAASLSEALQGGRLGESVVDGQPMPVPSELTTVLVAASRPDAATRSFVAALTERGLAPPTARALAESVTGLLNGGTISPVAFSGAVEAFNAAVDGAPMDFLVSPPREFLVVRAVLMTLLDGTAV
jgi:hypothetical protein